jgi:Rrf2 family protein
MPHISRGVEYGLHCMLYLAQPDAGTAPSAQELAEFQGISRTFVAKLFTRLEKAGLVRSSPGARGGYSLARSPSEISVLDVVQAIDGHKSLFECTEIRRNCAVFKDAPPSEVTSGLCGINRIMREAEQAMRSTLAARTLADIGSMVVATIPIRFVKESQSWFESRAEHRTNRPRKRRTDDA